MGLIIPIITGLLLLYLDFKSRKKIRKNVHGKFSLKLNSTYKWLGIICCFIGSFLLNVAIIHWNEEIYIMATFTVLAFLSLGVVMLIWYYNYDVVFDERGIIARSYIEIEKKLHWAEIERAKFNATWGYLKLYSKKDKILILQHSVGFVEFLKIMESKTKFRIDELKIPFRINNSD